MSPEPAPVIVSALFAPEDQAWLDALRRAHFPPERNHLAAHLTLFHHLPPSVLAELTHRLRLATDAPPPAAEAAGILSLGGGTAIRIVSPGLSAIRRDLTEAFQPLLTPQDQAGWRPHVTIQNKVGGEAARSLQAALAESFRPRPVAISGLGLFFYRGGPWEPISRATFRR